MSRRKETVSEQVQIRQHVDADDSGIFTPTTTMAGEAAQIPVDFVSVSLLGIQNTAGEIKEAYGRSSYNACRQKNANVCI